jgi:predicted transcriptional regulator
MIEDITIPINDYPHMPYWGSLKEAMVQLSLAHEKGHDTILVFDEAYKLVGTLSQQHILIGLGLGGKVRGKKGVPVSWESLLGERTDEILSSPVKKFMSKPKATISMSEEILEACRIMSKKGMTILPVTNGDKIFGIVRLGDLFRHISNAILRL